MAVSMEIVNWLFRRIDFERGWKTLDVGESCVVHTPVADIDTFVTEFGHEYPSGEDRTEALSNLAYRSSQIGNPHIQTTFLSEVFEFANIPYKSIDVVIARKSQRIDLNWNKSTDIAERPFDLILNFGTTEHIINQYNAFQVLHEITKIGGYMFHMVPLVGYFDHGYFSYTPLFFEDLAKANDYEIAEMWAFGPQGDQKLSAILDRPSMNNPQVPYNDIDGWNRATIPIGVIAVLFRKRSDAPFRVSLELKTSAALEG